MKNDTFHFLLTYCTFFTLLPVFINFHIVCGTGRTAIQNKNRSLVTKNSHSTTTNITDLMRIQNRA